MSKRVPVSGGLFALVDDEDFDRVSCVKWSRVGGRATNKRQTYAANFSLGRLHRFVVGVTDPKIQVDHKNCDGLDCRKENLRVATSTQNCMNRRAHRTNKLGVKGVCWHEKSKSYIAQVSVAGVRKHLGCFDTVAEAKQAYDTAASAAYGTFFRSA